MSESAIRTQIKTILEGVTGIGVVHDYERWSNDWATFLTLFKHVAGSRINGWIITRFKVDEEEETTSHEPSIHHYKIKGMYSLDDSAASEKAFNLLIEAIRAAFRANYQLNGTATNTTPVKVPVIENRVFGSVLCHYCEMTLTAEEYDAWA
jgi:hypothetical protein